MSALNIWIKQLASLNIVYFAWVRERIGRDGNLLQRVDPTETVAALVGQLAAMSDGHARALTDQAKLRFALDQEFVQPDQAIGEAKELAIFPPVTGG